ncbi:MAG: hypothetical protein L0215_20835, partial [Gemmataceae bacterium]|nr:hypothetical protein [Gemmataceae bacterium]
PPWLGLLTQTILRNPLAFTYADLAGLGTTEFAISVVPIPAIRREVGGVHPLPNLEVLNLQCSIRNLQSNCQQASDRGRLQIDH